jgi:hypothetical protein
MGRPLVQEFEGLASAEGGRGNALFRRFGERP